MFSTTTPTRTSPHASFSLPTSTNLNAHTSAATSPTTVGPKDSVEILDVVKVNAEQPLIIDSPPDSAIPETLEDNDIDALFNDETEVPLAATPSTKRKHSTSDGNFVELDSFANDPQPSAKKARTNTSKLKKILTLPKQRNRGLAATDDTVLDADVLIAAKQKSRTTNALAPSIAKLKKSFIADRILPRPKPVIAHKSNHIAQKISLGAHLATSRDPFARRKVTEDTIKLDEKMKNENLQMAEKPTTRFRSWADPDDKSITWKVFPKSTPRMKHRGGNIVVANYFQNPNIHPDIFIEECKEDATCWIARVEDISEEALAGRRQELAETAKNEQMQKGRATGKGRGESKAPKGKAKAIQPLAPTKKVVKSKAQVEADEQAQNDSVQERKLAKKAKEKDPAVQTVRSGMRTQRVGIDKDLFS